MVWDDDVESVDQEGRVGGRRRRRIKVKKGCLGAADRVGHVNVYLSTLRAQTPVPTKLTWCPGNQETGAAFQPVNPAVPVSVQSPIIGP